MRCLLAAALCSILPATALAQTTVTYSTPGNYTYVVQPGVTSVEAQVWGGASSASVPVFGSAQGGAGGGFCQITFSVTTGQNIFLEVGLGGVPVEDSFSGGTISWVNNLGNDPPLGHSTGCIGGFGNAASEPGTGTFGDVNTTGGNGAAAVSGSGPGGGGGGGAGALGNGGNASGAIPGTGGSGGGGNGGAGTLSVGLPGQQPGGGGGGGTDTGGVCPSCGGNGGNGEIILTLTPSPTPPAAPTNWWFFYH
jgi:hypothetical protein